jgi:antirestriction protein ArdC/phage/plasmid primase-like uncharacterized protein
MADIKKLFHELVAEKLIEQLQNGTAPWLRPWDAGAGVGFMPMNPTTGKRYKGINSLALMAEQRGDPRWLTYKQAQAIEAQVRKGEKGTTIQYWKTHNEFNKTDNNGKPVLDWDGKPFKVRIPLERPHVFYATVFNAEQINGLPEFVSKGVDWNPIERAETILSASGADIKHVESDTACYVQSKDTIYLPDKAQFGSADKYYATALHELGHWTGHETRLNRDLAHPFGSTKYAIEELRAEIFSMTLGDEIGIGHDPGQHAAYVASWIQVLKNDPTEIFRAAADAEKIQDYVLAFERQQTQVKATGLSETVDHQQKDNTPEYEILTDTQKRGITDSAAMQLARRDNKEKAKQEKVLTDKLAGLAPLDKPTKYMEANGIPLQSGLFTDGNGNDIYIPLVDISGRQRTVISVQSDGNKQFVNFSEKDGYFYVIGGHKQIEAAQVVMVTDDLASGIAINKATNTPVAVTFSSDSLLAAAKDIRGLYPDKGIVIAGEHGNTKADEAARAVNGKAAYPIFATGETNTESAGLSTFNDLAVKSKLGEAAIKRQLNPVVKQLKGQGYNLSNNARKIQVHKQPNVATRDNPIQARSVKLGKGYRA